MIPVLAKIEGSKEGHLVYTSFLFRVVSAGQWAWRTVSKQGKDSHFLLVRCCIISIFLHKHVRLWKLKEDVCNKKIINESLERAPGQELAVTIATDSSRRIKLQRLREIVPQGLKVGWRKGEEGCVHQAWILKSLQGSRHF